MIVPLQLTPGMVIGGDFEVERILSVGGMGAVYVAQQHSTGKARALKVMHPQLVADPRLRERFEQEARVGALIHSSHVVEVISAGVDAGSGAPWIAMELLEGTNLGEYALAHGCLAADELLEVLRQVCHALGAAHRVGVVHRDIKPENIFVCDTQSVGSGPMVKVLDFGIARVAAHAKTTATRAMGSPAWMAPEQTDPKAVISPATDTWALGLMVFWLLTGHPFWVAAGDHDASMHTLMREILFEKIPTATERASELGVAGRLLEGFDGWFARCVERDPSRRFESADELFSAFERLRAEPIQRAVVHTTGPAPSRSPRSLAHGATEPLASPPPNELPASSRPMALRTPRPRHSDGEAPTADATRRPAPRDVVSPTAAPLVSEMPREFVPDSSPRGQRRPRLPASERWRNRTVLGAAALLSGAIVWSSSQPTVEPLTPMLNAMTPPATRRLASGVPPTDPPEPAPPQSSPSVAPKPHAPAAKVMASPRPQPAATKPAKFDYAEAKLRMGLAARTAKTLCGALSGPRSFSVQVTWANDGVVSSVQVGGGTTHSAAGNCSANTFHPIRLNPYEGARVTLSEMVILE